MKRIGETLLAAGTLGAAPLAQAFAERRAARAEKAAALARRDAAIDDIIANTVIPDYPPDF